MRKREEKKASKASHSSSASSSNRVTSTWKKRWAGALLSEKCCCFVRKPSWKRTFWPSGDFLVQYFRDAFLAPLDVLFVMKTLEDER